VGKVIFRCQTTGKEFDSGFQADLSDKGSLPADSKMQLRCKICGELHEFKLSDARISD
jgi:hypothetical protein